MTAGVTRVMSWQTMLQLGRVSNLPTVWTNVLAGIVLAGGTLTDTRTFALIVAMSLFYLGGMYLNDAFDAEIDAAERSERPIPSGRASRSTVFAAGFAMLATGLLIVGWISTGAGPVLAGLALAAAIIFYDWYHKANPLSPVVMGLCRALVYVTAGLCFTALAAGNPLDRRRPAVVLPDRTHLRPPSRRTSAASKTCGPSPSWRPPVLYTATFIPQTIVNTAVLDPVRRLGCVRPVAGQTPRQG